MNVFLINLDRSTDRLAFVREQFTRLGIVFERIPAVDGASFSRDEIETFAKARPSAPPEAWSKGAIGAFLSHAAACERIAAGADSHAAVFEDDVHIAADTAALLASDGWIPNDADVVRLEGMGTMKLSRGKRIPCCPGRRIHRAISGTWGAAGYILSRAAASTLLAAPESVHIPFDHLLFSPSLSPLAAQLHRYQVVPSVCIQDQIFADGAVGFGSSITPEKRMPPHKPARTPAFRFLRRHAKIAVEFRS